MQLEKTWGCGFPGEILLDLEVFSRYPWLVAWGEAEAEKCVCVCARVRIRVCRLSDWA